ncbi:vesicle-associated membrane protein/synaptobrevin-binding protein [Plakobranchus ocellatus]|uniref:Vesicle-associated membrane protein/synaptobrevin-binding protein n=1 Tax=Plakobranchus ocellatus TaxID=259542 RepID=A0AAV3YB00_9GAST|nr:vesicle-associated membrane protein/synaptobrevin-binding protein [Plakobranchus ocellatus]
MAYKEQALRLEPSTELRFKGPFTDVVVADLNLTNPTDKRICFKVKTTAPKRYCVRPNSGILEPRKSICVAAPIYIFIQWKDAPPESLMDTKLRCVFELPEGPQSQMITPESARQSEGGATLFNDSTLDSSVKKDSPKRASPPSGEEVKKLQHEIRKAMAEINSLKVENNQLKDEGVRLRKVAITDTVRSTPSHPTETSTTPVSAFPPVVYIIAAIVLGLIIGKFIL